MSLNTPAFEDIFALLGDAPVGIALVGAGPGEAGRLLQVNRTLCEMVGFTEAELAELTLAALVHPGDAGALARLAVGGDGPAQIELRLRRRSGGHRWVLASAAAVTPTVPGDCRLVHFVDISARRRAEEDLIEREQRLRTIIDTSQEGFWEYDAARVLVHVNPGLAELLGYAVEEMVGTNVDSFIGTSDLAASHARERQRIEGRNPPHFEIHLRRKDGSEVWAEVSSTARRDADGRYVGSFGFVRDVTEARRARLELSRAIELQRALARNLPDTVALLFDHELRYVLVEGEAAQRRDMPAFLGHTLHDIPGLSDARREEYAVHYRRALAGEELKFEAVFGGRTYAVTIGPVRNPDGEVHAGLVVARDISEAYNSRLRLLDLAENDQLTGLPNRASFRVRLDQALVAAREGRRAVLMLLDMDNFKSVNDSLGHDAGDELLKIIAGRLRSVVRPTDVIARLSGDEFTVLVEGLDEDQEIAVVARRVLGAFDAPVSVAGQELFVKASLGIARLPADGDTAAAALKAADMAMYAAKRDGHNGYRVFQETMAQSAEARLRVSSELHRAVLQEELELHYQPQLWLADERVSSVEALVRWRHADRGLMAPEQFIAVAEESGLIVELGERVLRGACAQLVDWRERGVPVPRVAVNVSVHQLHHGSFPDTVRRALAESGLPASALELEITESALMDLARAAGVLEELKRIGVTIAIDDFGTGYSSLGRLRRLPIDLLKIDRSFVADADRDSDAAALARSIVGLAHNLGLAVLAEGVERPEQLQLLRQQGCDYVAGWLWTPARPAAELEAWLAAHPAG
ncbi:MAG TPA: EAL domain-containing protein [Solirubrobacteraceae bacterium]|nr:EAL domain-containing protein [Solirubrobacteraceae bacterium]